MKRHFITGFSTLLVCTSLTVNASDDTLKNNSDVIGLATLSPSFLMMDIVAGETIRRIEAQGIRSEHIMRDATSEQILQSTRPGLLLAGLDTFVDQWNDQDVRDNGALLGTLIPVVEIVRDHQAFVMQQKRNAQELRSRFAMAHGASGPMSIGGLTPRGHKDHLVAMMLMDAAGQDPTEYPYRQYESLESMVMALLTDEVQILSIPVSQALQMPSGGGITTVATSGNERQDVMKNVPTLVEARLDMRFTNYIGLYTRESDLTSEQLQSLQDLFDLSVSEQWPEQVYKLGLIDDYFNKGEFAANVLRELATLQNFANMLD